MMTGVCKCNQYCQWNLEWCTFCYRISANNMTLIKLSYSLLKSSVWNIRNQWLWHINLNHVDIGAQWFIKLLDTYATLCTGPKYRGGSRAIMTLRPLYCLRHCVPLPYVLGVMPHCYVRHLATVRVVGTDFLLSHVMCIFCPIVFTLPIWDFVHFRRTVPRSLRMLLATSGRQLRPRQEKVRP